MKSNKVVYRKLAFWAGSVALFAPEAAVLGLWMTQGASLRLWPIVVGLAALTAALGAIWFYRSRAARRRLAVLDAYAEKELARAEHRRSTSVRKRNDAFSRNSI